MRYTPRLLSYALIEFQATGDHQMEQWENLRWKLGRYLSNADSLVAMAINFLVA